MPKRNATSELNHDNWNDEEAPEEAGTFQKAAADVIEKRVIRSARRRALGNSGSVSSDVFSGFQGFNKTSENPSPFSFLKKNNSIQESTAQNANEGGESKVEISSQIPMFKLPVKEVSSSPQDSFLPTPPYTSSYLSQVKRLNECFLKHIQTCFDESKFIILSPCFRDYNKHLMNLLPLNDSSDKCEGENQTSDLKMEVPLFQKQGLGDELSPKVVSGSKNNLSGNINTETSVGMGFKIFGGGEGNPKSPSSNLMSIGTPSPFGVPVKKQFSLLSGWSGSNIPNQKTTSEPTSEETQAGTTAHATEEPAADDSDVPPKVEFKQVVEEGAVYSRRCKVFVKKDISYHDHGVGRLYLKPVESGKKTQLIVRADTSLGNLLVNTLLSADMSMQKMGSNNVMLICVPTPDNKPPKPLPVLLRVKTSDDADELLQKLNEFKK